MKQIKSDIKQFIKLVCEGIKEIPDRYTLPGIEFIMLLQQGHFLYAYEVLRNKFIKINTA